MKVSTLIAKGKAEGVEIRVTHKLDDPAIEYRRDDDDIWLFGGWSQDVLSSSYSQLAPVIADLLD